MKQSSVRISNLDFHGSSCDGPGIRNVVFFQGCARHCPGCHNPGTWDRNGGHDIPVRELVDIIDRETPMERVTISGGEPLLQFDGLLELVESLHRRVYDIAVYTGNRLTDIPSVLLNWIDYIKVGDYRSELRTLVKPFVGSSNQEFIKLH